jgi:hypothetical protein
VCADIDDNVTIFDLNAFHVSGQPQAEGHRRRCDPEPVGERQELLQLGAEVRHGIDCPDLTWSAHQVAAWTESISDREEFSCTTRWMPQASSG